MSLGKLYKPFVVSELVILILIDVFSVIKVALGSARLERVTRKLSSTTINSLASARL